MVTVNIDQINLIAGILKTVQFRQDFLKREFLSFDGDRETKLRLYFLSAAICHQTRTLVHPDKNLWGWEYMEYGFLQLLKQRNPLLNPGYLSICSNQDVAEMLRQTFSPDGDPKNCTLDRIEERTFMLLEICRIVKAHYKSRISNLIDETEGRLIHGGKGLYESLARFTAFSDPQNKKITFFLKLARDAGVINIKDPQNLMPIMDYHMQRVLLRTGCVEVEDQKLKNVLASKSKLSSDEPIRGKCIEAFRVLSKQSGLDILVLNDIFWPLGRSCCNDTTLCTGQQCSKKPCTLTQMIELEEHNRCIFQEVCQGVKDESYRSLFEPMVDTHYY